MRCVDLRYRLMTDDVFIGDSAASMPDAKAPDVKRGRGRPPKGDPVLVRLAPAERAFAEDLGGGVVAEGIRLALVASERLGIDTVRLLASEKKTIPPKIERQEAQHGDKSRIERD